MAVPAGERAALEVVQAEAGLQLPVVVLDGLITNGKFCCVRRVWLSLSCGTVRCVCGDLLFIPMLPW